MIWDYDLECKKCGNKNNKKFTAEFWGHQCNKCGATGLDVITKMYEIKNGKKVQHEGKQSIKK